MINLSFLITIPGIIMGSIFLITSNYRLNYIPKETNNLNHITLLEENYILIPYILRKYYINVVNITANLFLSLLSSSFWHNNSEYEKEKLVNENEKFITILIKKIGLFLSLVLYGLLLAIWFRFNPLFGNYQLLTYLGLNKEIWNLDVTLGLDGVSLPFVLLTGFIIPIVYLSNWSTIYYKEAYYILIIVLLELFLVIVFLVIDLVMFYVFFESILPPLFLLIGLYGASQKFRAGYYLFLYTLFGSLFMLLSFVKLGGDTGSTFFDNFASDTFYQFYQELICLILFFSFSVKTPLVPVHIWLPLAHSDANLSGSIILASIVLKLALYGFIRILINILSSGTSIWVPIFLALCALSVMYASCTTVRQFDLKVIVAYSSIAHMASSLLGTFSDTLSGIVGSIIFGLAHGFVSPGLFIIVGGILYDRGGSRIINYFKGLTNLMPLTAVIFLLFIFANMGVPLTANFIGEFLSLIGAYEQNIFIASFGTTSVILSAVYSIYLYNRTTSGSLSPHILTIPDIFRKEYYIIIPLLLLTLILGIYPSIITSEIDFAISHCLLFSLSPIVLNNKEVSEEEVKKLHETNFNPHNTPVVGHSVPSSSRGNGNPSFSTSVNANSSSEIQENNTNEMNSLNIGNPNSEEGNSSFVSLDDKKNQPVESKELKDKLEDYRVKEGLNNNEESVNSSNNSNNVENNNTDSVSNLDSGNNIPDSTAKSTDNLSKVDSESASSSRPTSKSDNMSHTSSNFADDERESNDENGENVSDSESEVGEGMTRVFTYIDGYGWVYDDLRDSELEQDSPSSDETSLKTPSDHPNSSSESENNENERVQNRSDNEEEQNIRNNISDNSSNNNNGPSSNTSYYTMTENEYVSNLPFGNYIYIFDNLFIVLDFIHNNLTLNFANITPINIFFLFITFISYFRYYILWISYKKLLYICFIVLNFRIKEIFSYFNKR